MKKNMLKLFMVILVLTMIGAGVAFAGGYKNHSSYSYKSAHRGYQNGGGYYHQPPYYHPRPGYRHPRPYYYGPPARYYNHGNYYYRGCDRYDERYNFSGAYSEPGFGFVFGTRGSW